MPPGEKKLRTKGYAGSELMAAFPLELPAMLKFQFALSAI
jgi:hypothetical protein